MKLVVSEDLSRLEVWADGKEPYYILGSRSEDTQCVLAAIFDNPVLLTDFYKTAKLPAGQRDCVFALYNSYPRTVSYNNTNVSWSQFIHPGVWGPSIDTLFFAKGLKPFLKDVRKAAEIGCGSGFLTKYIMQHSPKLESIIATDINLDAVSCAASNITDLPNKFKAGFISPDVDAIDLGLHAPCDLIISNPPYLPRPFAKHNNAYEGLDLVYKLSLVAKELLLNEGRLIINLSNLAGDEPLTWFTTKGFKCRSLAELEVPLKVNSVTGGLTQESEAWLAYLAANCGLKNKYHDGYEYWHTLRLFELTK